MYLTKLPRWKKNKNMVTKHIRGVHTVCIWGCPTFRCRYNSHHQGRRWSYRRVSALSEALCKRRTLCKLLSASTLRVLEVYTSLQHLLRVSVVPEGWGLPRIWHVYNSCKHWASRGLRAVYGSEGPVTPFPKVIIRMSELLYSFYREFYGVK